MSKATDLAKKFGLQNRAGYIRTDDGGLVPVATIEAFYHAARAAALRECVKICESVMDENADDEVEFPATEIRDRIRAMADREGK